MYVTNPEVIDKNKLYECNGVIGAYLVNERNIPLFSREKRVGKWYFIKTKALLKAIEEMPFYYNISKIIW